MDQDPDFLNDGEQNSYDEGFVRTGYILIEDGLDADGESAYRFKHTCARPLAIGMLQIILDHLRWREARGWAAAASGPEDEDE